MTRHRRAFLRFASAILSGIMLGGCGGASEPAAQPGSATDTASAGDTTNPAPTPKKLSPTPRDVPGLDAADAALVTGYLGWTELTQPPIAELQRLGSAHGGQKRVWASPQRQALVDHGTRRFPYPDGTVIVKQGTQGDAVTLIALMEKTGAGGAGTGGWRYAEYTRATADDAFTKVGLAQSGCAGCHLNANTRQQTDWVFWSVR